MTKLKIITQSGTANSWNRLYEWQRDAVGKFFDFDKKMIAIVPTGAGKTYFAIYIIKKLLEEDPNMRIIIIVPKIVVVNTWLDEFYSNGFYLQNIGVYKGGCKEFSKITITTIASAKRLDMRMFDFAIFDELHNFGAPTMKKIVSKNFKAKLGLTATPDRSDDKHWKIFKDFDYNIYEYDIKDALKDEVLNRYDFFNIKLKLPREEYKQYEAISIQIASLMTTIGGYNAFLGRPGNDKQKIALMKYMDMRKKLVWHNKQKLEIVANLCKHYNDGSKIIVFSQYNSTTNALYYHLGSRGIKAAVIHSNISDKEKVEGLKQFDKGNINVILTTKVLDEGYNLPKIDVGIILAGEQSQRQLYKDLVEFLEKKLRNLNYSKFIFLIHLKKKLQTEKQFSLKDLVTNLRR